jgi:hypothetical protein
VTNYFVMVVMVHILRLYKLCQKVVLMFFYLSFTHKDVELDARLTKLELNWRHKLSRAFPDNANGE